MTAQDLCHEAGKRGLRLKPVGDKLAVMPARRCPPDFADVLRRHKGELLAWLEGRTAGLCPDQIPWLHVARQILDGEFEDCDRSTRESLIIGLRSVPHLMAESALTRLHG